MVLVLTHDLGLRGPGGRERRERERREGEEGERGGRERREGEEGERERRERERREGEEGERGGRKEDGRRRKAERFLSIQHFFQLVLMFWGLNWSPTSLIPRLHLVQLLLGPRNQARQNHKVLKWRRQA